MILTNTAANRKLVKKMEDLATAETGFKLSVNLDWNCGEDIRAEIVTFNDECPFVVSTWYSCGEIEAKVRMLETVSVGYEITEWRDWFVALDDLVKAMKELIAKEVA